MDFENQTIFSADVWRTQLFYKDLLMAIVVVKATFRGSPEGQIYPDEDNQLPLQEGPQETPFGTIDGDYAPIKEHVDVMVLGNAHAPKKQPTDRMTVEVRIGKFSNFLSVFGDRHWTKDGNMTAPAPFLILPLTYANAFGGTSREYNNIEGNFAPNPLGKGYLAIEEEVEGTPLPNIEDPEERIITWKDHPNPAGFAPLPTFSSLRGMRGVRVDLNSKTTILEPLHFNCAHPRMMISELPLNSQCRLTGMTENGLWEFKIPEIYLGAEICLGKQSNPFLMRPDTFGLLPEERRFFILFRRAFVYPFIPEQERKLVVKALDAPTAAEIAKVKHPSLNESASDPASPITLEPLMKDTKVLPLSYERLMEYYPLTEIIHALPVCEA